MEQEISLAVQRVMDRYFYIYQQCCEMPLILLVFLHNCILGEERETS